jgi:hypothetical protein
LFVEIADAYFDREMYAQARPIYEMLGQDAGVRCPSAHHTIASWLFMSPID